VLLHVSTLLAGQNNLNESEVRRRIVGTWKLISAEDTLKDGTKRPFFGPRGQGFLMYSADGYMCAALMDPDRPKWKNLAKPTMEEKASAFDGFYSYCGRYEVDAGNNCLIHLPEVSSGLDYVGTRQLRPYRFEGSRMILSDRQQDDPEVASWEIVWEKVR